MPEWVRTSHEADDRLLSEHNIRRAKKWMHDCVTTHLSCSSAELLPLWVIEISQDRSARLVRGNGRIARYAALSYKWGTTPKFALQSSDQTLLEHGIPLKRLPTTFLDALKVSYDLGYSYLWIDALCITQDSKIELEDQVAAMQTIFSKSDLTLFAVAGINADAGLDCSRDAITARPVRVELKIQTMPTMPCSGKTVFIQGPLLGVETENQPLFPRGWVYQEQVLSRRSLTFTDSQIEWQCPSNCLSERDPRGLASHKRGIDDARMRMKEVRDFVHPYRKNAVAKWMNKTLYCALQEYSKRQLTFPSDVIPAISGLLFVYAECFDVNVEGGLRSDDVRGFLWYIPYFSKRAKTVADIPTWSWTSHFGHDVRFWFLETDTRAPRGEMKVTLRPEIGGSCMRVTVTS